MSTSHKLLCFAIVGCLALLSVLAHFAHGDMNNPIHNIGNEQTHSSQEPLSIDNRVWRPTFPAHEPIKSDYDTTPCKPNEDNRWSDLCAQWKAADAAYESARWTLAGVWIGGAGLVGVLATVIFTGLAFRAAKEANKIASNTAEKQLRAYVHVMDSEVKYPPSGGFVVNFKVMNLGQTPARNIRMLLSSSAGKLGYPIPTGNRQPSPKPGLAPQQFYYAPYFATGPVADIAMMLARQEDWRAYIYGIIEYCDVFGNERYTKFRCAVDHIDHADDANAKVVIRWCPEGNDAT
ncbi:hypothetical protein [Niveispirillum sp.]|uniref:hypothetical protein n=1 Tax=Niveispirillum sp. TaxID=1917217 RepID=UPI001B3D58BA|nr:hypothetical protein [Niveispirillum sp.]MBP7334379.1 hypothetical protein [Niveispirillum sp.]